MGSSLIAHTIPARLDQSEMRNFLVVQRVDRRPLNLKRNTVFAILSANRAAGTWPTLKFISSYFSLVLSRLDDRNPSSGG
jgi:hypothetical protein